MFIPKDKYLWDFWIIEHRGIYHLFYLQAPKDLPDPEQRHGVATVGHAISEDLKFWEEVGTALEPGPPGTWDDRAIWTGSVIEHKGAFYTLYTGTSKAEEGKIERIGLAISTDLIHWEKHPANPVLEADPRWYEVTPSTSPFNEVAWRDPYVLKERGQFCAFITARRKIGNRRWRGCIGLAKSTDLTSWQIYPPIKVFAKFAQMEVPQVITQRGHVFLLFSARAEWAQSQNLQVTGTFYSVADTVLGPFSKTSPLLANSGGTFYGGKIIRDPFGRWVMLAWIGYKECKFIGALSDPLPVEINSDMICVADG